MIDRSHYSRLFSRLSVHHLSSFRPILSTSGALRSQKAKCQRCNTHPLRVVPPRIDTAESYAAHQGLRLAD